MLQEIGRKRYHEITLKVKWQQQITTYFILFDKKYTTFSDLEGHHKVLIIIKILREKLSPMMSLRPKNCMFNIESYSEVWKRIGYFADILLIVCWYFVDILLILCWYFAEDILLIFCWYFCWLLSLLLLCVIVFNIFRDKVPSEMSVRIC